MENESEIVRKERGDGRDKETVHVLRDITLHKSTKRVARMEHTRGLDWK